MSRENQGLDYEYNHIKLDLKYNYTIIFKI